MKKLIKEVLDDLEHGQINLGSKSAREMVANLISAALKAKGSYKEHTDHEINEEKARASWVCAICGKNTYDMDWDYIGSGTNHLSCEVRLELDEKYLKKNWSQKKHENKVFDPFLSFPIVKEDEEKEKMKLAEEIIERQEGKWIYESPDGGKTVFRRPFSNYDPKYKEEINWKTKKPTGRVFTQYPFPPKGDNNEK